MADFGRPDYNLITTGELKIADNEPVFLLRAQDYLAYDIVMRYAFEAEKSGNFEVASAARLHARKFRNWPTKKSPDVFKHHNEPPEQG
jgi:hypothetical protein